MPLRIDAALGRVHNLQALNFVSFVERSWGKDVRYNINNFKTYAGVVHKDVKALLLSLEGFDSRFDSREIGQIEMQKFDAAVATGRRLFDCRDSFLCFRRRATCNVDSGIQGIENSAQLKAYASIAACDEENL